MDYLDIEEAAKRLGRSTKTLRRWIVAHKIDYQVRNGKYLFSLDDLEAKRTGTSSDRVDNLALLERIEALESKFEALASTTQVERFEAAVSQIEAINDRLREIETMVQQKPVTVPSRPATPRRTKLVHNGAHLPDGLVGFRQFADLHNIAQLTVQRAIESRRLEVVRGHWKHGRAIVQMALDQPGRRRFFDLFFENPGFKACPQCPHDV